MKEYAVYVKNHAGNLTIEVYMATDGDYLNRNVICLHDKYRTERNAWGFKTRVIAKRVRDQLDELVEQLKADGYAEIPYSRFSALWNEQYFAKARAEFEAHKAVEC